MWQCWIDNGGLVMFDGVCCGESGFDKRFGFGFAVVAWWCLIVSVMVKVGWAVGF